MSNKICCANKHARDLYTLSKLMGHRSIETTQIYAKILDKTKQAAVARIPEIF